MNATGIGRTVVAALTGCTLLTSAALAQTTQIGAIGAVNPRTTGQPPDAAAPRQLVIADRIVLNERIQSGPDGAAQVMFLDQTTLTVGPNSDVVVDSFLYDPEQAAGEMALSLARGAMRFIGGRITKSNEATVNVADAVVALRGGIADLRLVEGGAEATFLGGEFMTVTQRDQTVTVSRPGGRVLIGLDGGGLAPGLIYAGVVDAVATANLFQTTSTAGGGGARQTPSAGQGAQAVAASLEAGAPTAAPISTSGERLVTDIVSDGVQIASAGFGADISATLLTNVATITDPNVINPPTLSFGDVALNFTFRIFDSGAQDGDVINLRVSDVSRVLIDSPGLSLTNAGDFFTPNPGPGTVLIEVTAVNEGRLSPNTGAVEITNGLLDGPGFTDFTLNTGESQTLSLRATPAD